VEVKIKKQQAHFYVPVVSILGHGRAKAFKLCEMSSSRRLPLEVISQGPAKVKKQPSLVLVLCLSGQSERLPLF